MGIPNEYDHTDLIAMLKKIIDTADRHHVAAGCWFGKTDQPLRTIRQGARLVVYSNESAMMRDAMELAFAQMRALARWAMCTYRRKLRRFLREGLHGPVAAHPQGNSYVQQLACEEDRRFPHYLLNRAGRDCAAAYEQKPESALRTSIGCTVVCADRWWKPESAVGQPRRFDCVPPTSALPPSTDIVRSARQVRFVPLADIQKSDASICWPRTVKLAESTACF